MFQDGFLKRGWYVCGKTRVEWREGQGEGPEDQRDRNGRNLTTTGSIEVPTGEVDQKRV